MATVYILAHFDDEYCAWPLIRQAVAEGREQRFIHMVDYRSRELSARRLAETVAFLEAQGVPAGNALHLGAETGWQDGELHRHAKAAYAALRAAVTGPVERIVCPAWEGGHPDHDVCAAMAAKLAAELGGVPVDQISLYQGKGLPWILYRASTPIPENGPVRSVRLSPKDWARWLGAAATFPSQLKAWAGLLPAMIATFALQGAFRYQALDLARPGVRPHSGPLLYEKMFRTPYAVVREAVDALTEDGKAPWTGA
jgi:LmbE family N-acetylglucosaminyl deacetylase